MVLSKDKGGVFARLKANFYLGLDSHSAKEGKLYKISFYVGKLLIYERQHLILTSLLSDELLESEDWLSDSLLESFKRKKRLNVFRIIHLLLLFHVLTVTGDVTKQKTIRRNQLILLT